MQVGTLVKWIANGEDKDSIGLIIWSHESAFAVKWSDGEVVEYNFHLSHSRYVEVICE